LMLVATKNGAATTNKKHRSRRNDLQINFQEYIRCPHCNMMYTGNKTHPKCKHCHRKFDTEQAAYTGFKPTVRCHTCHRHILIRKWVNIQSRCGKRSCRDTISKYSANYDPFPVCVRCGYSPKHYPYKDMKPHSCRLCRIQPRTKAATIPPTIKDAIKSSRSL